LHRDPRHISFACVVRTQALRTPGCCRARLPRHRPQPGRPGLHCAHYRTARQPRRAGMRAPPRIWAALAGPHRSATADVQDPSGPRYRP
jgi:hypothetical protein